MVRKPESIAPRQGLKKQYQQPGAGQDQDRERHRRRPHVLGAPGKLVPLFADPVDQRFERRVEQIKGSGLAFCL